MAQYPVKSKHVAGLVNGIATDVMVLSFSDKIMITITQEGRLAQWMQVPMNANNPNRSSEHYLASSNEDEDFPVSHLTANTLLGGANSERETKGQLYAVQMANAIALQNPEESRTVMVGFGLKAESASREEFFDLMDLVTKCL